MYVYIYHLATSIHRFNDILHEYMLFLYSRVDFFSFIVTTLVPGLKSKLQCFLALCLLAKGINISTPQLPF